MYELVPNAYFWTMHQYSNFLTFSKWNHLELLVLFTTDGTHWKRKLCRGHDEYLQLVWVGTRLLTRDYFLTCWYLQDILLSFHQPVHVLLDMKKVKFDLPKSN